MTGHYAPAVVHAGLVYVSGTLPSIGEGQCDPAAIPFESQMRSLLRKCDDVLTTAGSRAANVISMTLYLTDLGRWPQADALLAEYFGRHRPARAVINVPAIRLGFAVQATLIASVEDLS